MTNKMASWTLHNVTTLVTNVLYDIVVLYTLVYNRKLDWCQLSNGIEAPGYTRHD